MLDQNQVPYLITGDAAPGADGQRHRSGRRDVLREPERAWVQRCWVNLLPLPPTRRARRRVRRSMRILPFTGTIPSTSSYDLEAYPTRRSSPPVDRLIALAARYDLQILLDPLETGSWLTTALDNGTTKCRNYGYYLGNRYRSFDNIVWMSGNDFQGWRDEANDAVGTRRRHGHPATTTRVTCTRPSWITW